MMRVLPFPVAVLRLLHQSVMLALVQVWANKMRSLLTALGIIIGVASVTAVIAALTGLKTNILDEFETFGTNKIYLFPDTPETGRFKHASWTQIRFTPELFDDLLEHCPDVERLTRITRFNTSLRHGERVVESSRVTGIEPDWHDIENRTVIMGRQFTMTDQERTLPVCLITEDLRDRLRMDRDCIGQTLLLDDRRFMVVGLVEASAESHMFRSASNEAEVFIPFNTAWRLRQPFMFACVTSRSPDVSDEARSQVRYYLRQARNLRYDDPDTFDVQVMEQYLQQFQRLAGGITAVAGGIVAVSLLVGGIGIMNIMLVSVSERTREIGLRKAVGARPSAIMLQFLVEAVILCLLGGGAGVLLGEAMTAGLSRIEAANLDQAYIPLWAMAMSFGFAATVGIVFGMFPAIKAARLDPIEALRHE